MKHGRLPHLLFIKITLLGLLALPVLAFTQPANADIATIQGYGNVIYWSIDPGVRYQSVKVTLSSGTGDVVVIETDQQPTTDALDDGNYKFELVVSPLLSRSVRAEMKAARDAAGGQEARQALREMKRRGRLPGKRMIQSGFFRIVNGQLVTAEAAQE